MQPSPSPPAASTGPTPGEEKEEPDNGEGIFGPFRLGPVVGAGLPNVLSFGATAKLTPYFGFGINIGIIPTIKVSMYGEATVSYQEYDAYARIFPMGGSFFLGAGVGYATVRGTLLSSISLPPPSPVSKFDLTSEASVRTMVLTPQIGFFHTFGSGFSLGIDFGAQVPIAPSEINLTTNVPPYVPHPYTDDTNQKVMSTLEKLGKTILPTFNVRMGWLL